jgi:hypothetical protein
VVDLRVHGATGSVDAAGTRGITLAPGELRRVPLVDIAPGSAELTVEVVTSRGRVHAAVADELRGLQASGVEWLPPAPAPAREVLLAGVPSRADRRTLLVTNPGQDQAVVELRVQTADGAFAPVGLEKVSVDPESVATVDLTGPLRDGAAAVLLRSDLPVTATLRSDVGADHADAASVTPLEGPAVVPVAGGRTVVQLAAGPLDSAAHMTAWSSAGRLVARKVVAVGSSRLAEWPVPPSAAYVVVVPDHGELGVAAVHTGPGTSVEPAMPLPETRTRPDVRLFTG